MDRAWMYDLARIDPMYVENVRQFVEELMRHAIRQNKNDIFCPCVECENKIAWPDPKVIQSHLINRGFKRNYMLWIKHGEIDDTLHEVTQKLGITILMVYLMETILTLLMMMMILTIKSYCITSNHMC
jgi:hypothetical protein